MFESLEELKKNRRAIRRRRFLATGLAGVACYFGWRWWRFRPQPVPQITRPFITPNEEFFRISIQPGFRPEMDLKEWRLTLIPPRGSSIAMSYEDLRKLGKRQIPRTLMCVGNPIGGGGLGNAVWTGVSLRLLLEKICDLKREDLRVVFRAMDGFHSSVPLDAAVDPDTYLVYEMNGEALPAAHGYPLRVLIPGKYGMKQPRWLQEIEVTSDLALGYWERWGWSNDCEIRMTAYIDSVVKISETERRVSGIAFCGREAVGRVEVSDDEGDSWMRAHLRQTPLPGVWCGWDFVWRPSREAQYVLTARVVDALGTRQIESYSGSYPSGSTGLHRVIVDAWPGKP